MKKKLLKGCTLLLIALILLYASVKIINIIKFSEIDKEMNSMADSLGYKKEDFVDEYKACYDIFAHCYKFFIFKTDHDFEKFSSLVKNIKAFNTSGGSDISGYEIFTKINLRSNSSITINGSDALGDRSQLPRIFGNRWNVAIPNTNDFITIDFYDLAYIKNVKLNSTDLGQNLVVIQYQYK